MFEPDFNCVYMLIKFISVLTVWCCNYYRYNYDMFLHQNGNSVMLITSLKFAKDNWNLWEFTQ